jgi:hypothetical protein
MDGGQSAARRRGAESEVASALPHGEALRRAPDQSVFVVESGFGQPATVAAKQGARLQADPFSERTAREVDGQIAVEEYILVEVQNGADAVAGIGRDCNALIRARRLTLHQRMIQAKPDRARPVEKLSLGKAGLDQAPIPGSLPARRRDGDGALGDRLWRARRRMALRPVGDDEILLALHESCESCDVLAAGNQPA